jgi:16S rRNA G527 N7-methylase RsmG
LSNVTVVQADVSDWEDAHDGVVMRAVLRPTEAFPQVRSLLRPGRTAVIGLSRGAGALSVDALAASAKPHDLELELVEVPVLDSPATLLRITRNDHLSK